jgi:CheY-like chemotaxis protein
VGKSNRQRCRDVSGAAKAGGFMNNVLVIDDDDEMRDFVLNLLRRRNYSASGVQNGEKGVASLTGQSFDLIITDIVMPDMEGLETIRRIREISPDIPIIAMSGGGDSRRDYLRFAEKLGASAVLAKPFDPTDLLNMAAQLLT